MAKAKKAKTTKKVVSKKAKKAKKVGGKSSSDNAKIIKVVCSASDWLELDDIPTNETNPRQITKERLERLKVSLKKGIFKPFTVRENGNGELELLAGNMRRLGLLELRKEGWFVPALPASYVDGTDEVAKAIIIRDNVNDGEWEMDGFSRYVAELSEFYQQDTADVLGMDKKDYGNLMEHYATLTIEAGGEAESMEVRKKRLVEHLMSTGLDETQAERQAEMMMMTGSDPNAWHGEGGKPETKGYTGKRYDLTFWFDTVDEMEIVSKAFSQPRTTELDGHRLARIAANIVKEMPANPEPAKGKVKKMLKPGKKAKKVKKAKKALAKA